MNRIRLLRVEKDSKGNYEHIRITFGPHYFVEITDKNGNLSFVLGATHHGFKADASEVNGELEKIINEVRKLYPQNVVD